MSGILKPTTTVLSGTTVDNVLTGSKFDYLPRAAVVTLYMVQEIVLSSNLVCDFTLGNVVVGDDLIPNIQAAGVGPKINEDVLAEGVGEGGDRITVRLRETTGGVGADGIARSQIVIKDI